jgi:hypothetical protein
MVSYDITDKNTSPMNDHLTNAHKFEKKMGHGKKDQLSTHQSQLHKQKAQANKIALLPPFHINADLWTSQVTGEKYLGVEKNLLKSIYVLKSIW